MAPTWNLNVNGNPNQLDVGTFTVTVTGGVGTNTWQVWAWDTNTVESTYTKLVSGNLFLGSPMRIYDAGGNWVTIGLAGSKTVVAQGTGSGGTFELYLQQDISSSDVTSTTPYTINLNLEAVSTA